MFETICYYTGVVIVTTTLSCVGGIIIGFFLAGIFNSISLSIFIWRLSRKYPDSVKAVWPFWCILKTKLFKWNRFVEIAFFDSKLEFVPGCAWYGSYWTPLKWKIV